MDNLDDSQWYDQNREIRKKQSRQIKSKRNKTKMIESGIDDYFNIKEKNGNQHELPENTNATGNHGHA